MTGKSKPREYSVLPKGRKYEPINTVCNYIKIIVILLKIFFLPRIYYYYFYGKSRYKLIMLYASYYIIKKKKNKNNILSLFIEYKRLNKYSRVKA